MLLTNVYNVVMAEMTASEIGERIRALRTERGWSQGQLSFRARVHSSHISMVEQGKRKPKTETLSKIADALGVTLADLLGEPASLYGNDWEEGAIREFAPDTPPLMARELLAQFNQLSHPDRKAALAMIIGLYKAEQAAETRNKIAERSPTYELEKDEQAAER